MSEGHRKTSGRRMKAIYQSIALWYCNLAHMDDGCRQQLCIHNCSQIATNRDMLTIDSLQEIVITLSNGTIADKLRHTV